MFRVLSHGSQDLLSVSRVRINASRPLLSLLKPEVTREREPPILSAEASMAGWWDARASTAWDAAGWTARGRTSGTGGNDWSADRRVGSDQERDEKLEKLEERVSSLEKQVRLLQETAEERVSSLEQKDVGIAADATDVYPSMTVEQEAAQPSHGHECEWHEPRPEKEDVYVGGAWLQSDMEVWFSHLRDTLYQSDNGPLNALQDPIRANWKTSM